MVSRFAALILVAALLAMSACGDDDSASGGDEPEGTTATTAPADPGDDESRDPDAALDCPVLADAHFIVVDSARFLASLVSNDQFDLIAEGVIDVDFEDIRAAIAGLRPLEDVENPLGSVEESLDRLDQVASLAVEAARDPDPESTDAFAEIQPLIEESAAFLAALGPVNYAFGESCQT